MPYIPDPSNDAQPTDDVAAKTAAAEFRAIKQFVTKIPQRSISSNIQFVYEDAGFRLFHPDADVTARVWTIPTDAAVPFPLGTVISIVNGSTAGDITIQGSGAVEVRLAGVLATGPRVFAKNATGFVEKVGTNLWYITGTGVT